MSANQNEDAAVQRLTREAETKLQVSNDTAAPKPPPFFNINASSFVPNFAAPAFVPGGAGSSFGMAAQSGFPFQLQPTQPTVQVAGVDSMPFQMTSSAIPAPAPFQPVEADLAPRPSPVQTTDAVPPKASSGPDAEARKPAVAAAPKSAQPTPLSKKKADSSSSGNLASDSKRSDPKPAVVVHEFTEEERALEDEFFADASKKDHLNIVFIGHVDAGKSTMGGHILYLTGMVDKRTLEKYEREAREQNRESWYLSWALDTNDEERAKGKTVECGRAFFETEKRRFTILDAPGHRNYVPHMISGASQADVGVLVISSRKGEFETGFEKGGQTREHAMLVKTAGVKQLVVVINKMDDPTVMWSKERYDECVSKLSPFLKKEAGFQPGTDLEFMPVSGFTGANLKDRLEPGVAPWYTGPSLLEFLDNVQGIDRKSDGPFMMPLTDRYKDMGTIVTGKIESGRVRKGQSVIAMPNKKMCEIMQLYTEQDDEIKAAVCGDQVRLRLKGVEEEDLSPGFVLCDPRKTIHTCSSFEAQLFIMDHKNIITAGYSAVMHVHTLAEEVTLDALLHLVDRKTNRKSKRPPPFVKNRQVVIVRLRASGPICIETYQDYPQLGRFTIRDEGKTVAMGKVLRLLED